GIMPISRVGENQRDIVMPQQPHKIGIEKARMANLDGMAQKPLAAGSGPGATLDAVVVPRRQMGRSFAVARQQCQKPVELFDIETEARRKLPQKRPELFFQPQYAGGEEIGERRLDVAQLFHMRDKTAALDREDKIRGRFSVPALEEFRPLQRVMRAVDLDRVDMPAGVGQLVLLAQLPGIKAAAPAAIAPAGDADADSAKLSSGGMTGGAAAHRRLPRRHARNPAC